MLLFLCFESSYRNTSQAPVVVLDPQWGKTFGYDVEVFDCLTHHTKARKRLRSTSREELGMIVTTAQFQEQKLTSVCCVFMIVFDCLR
jgi:hypothetical protein